MKLVTPDQSSKPTTRPIARDQMDAIMVEAKGLHHYTNREYNNSVREVSLYLVTYENNVGTALNFHT